MLLLFPIIRRGIYIYIIFFFPQRNWNQNITTVDITKLCRRDLAKVPFKSGMHFMKSLLIYSPELSHVVKISLSDEFLKGASSSEFL